MTHAEKCPVCGGKGRVLPEGPGAGDVRGFEPICHGCQGQGWVTVKDSTNHFASIPELYERAMRAQMMDERRLNQPSGPGAGDTRGMVHRKCYHNAGHGCFYDADKCPNCGGTGFEMTEDERRADVSHGTRGE